MISAERSHLSAVFRSFEDSCLASERIQDSTSKLLELDTRRQKIREASRLLKKPRQDDHTWMALTESLMMEFPTQDCLQILSDSMKKTEDDYALVNKQARDEMNAALKAKCSKDLESRGFNLKPINK